MMSKGIKKIRGEEEKKGGEGERKKRGGKGRRGKSRREGVRGGEEMKKGEREGGEI